MYKAEACLQCVLRWEGRHVHLIHHHQHITGLTYHTRVHTLSKRGTDHHRLPTLKHHPHVQTTEPSRPLTPPPTHPFLCDVSISSKSLTWTFCAAAALLGSTLMTTLLSRTVMSNVRPKAP